MTPKTKEDSFPSIQIFDAQIAVIKNSEDRATWYNEMEQALKAGRFQIEPACYHNGKIVIKIDLRKETVKP